MRRAGSHRLTSSLVARRRKRFKAGSGHGDGPADGDGAALAHMALAVKIERAGSLRVRPAASSPTGHNRCSDDAECAHRLGDADEARDVRAQHVVARRAIGVGHLGAAVVNAMHDGGETRFGGLERPRIARGVLLHFERAGGDAAGVGRLAGAEQDAGIEERAHRFRRARHVGAFAHGDDAALHELRRILAVELVLRRRRHGDIGRHVPDATLRHEGGGLAARLDVIGDAAALAFLDLLDERKIDAGLVDDIAVRVRAGDDMAAELDHLLHGVDGDVARAGHDHALALEILAAGLQHALDEIDRAVAGRLGAHLRAAPGEALAGEHAGLVAVGDALVLAEHEADLALANADVAGRHVGVFAEMTRQLGHERLAEAHDLALRTPLRIEIGAALAAADRHAGQRVLEHLLEAEKLHGAEIDGRVKAQSALERAQRGIELDAEAPVDLHLAFVVDPRHAEDDLPLRLADALDQRILGVVGMLGDHRAEALEHLSNGLMELFLGGIAA